MSFVVKKSEDSARSQTLPEIILRGEAEDELGHELDGVLDVVGVGGFDHGVHAAQWQGNETAGNTGTNVEDLVGVGAGEATAGFVLKRYLRSLGVLLESLDDLGMIGGAVGDAGPPPSSTLPCLL